MNVKTFIVIIIFFLSSRYLLMALGVEGFGLYNLVVGVSVTLEFIFSGLTSTTSRYTSMSVGKGDLVRSRQVFNTVNSANNKILIWFMLILEIFGLVMLYFVLKIPADYFKTALIIFQVMVLDSYFKMKVIPYNALLTAKENFLFINLVAIAVAILRLGGILLLLIYPFDRVIVYSLLIFILSYLSRAYTMQYCKKKYDEAYLDKINYYDKALEKDVFSFLKYSWIGQLSSIVKKQGANFLLNISSGGVALNAAYAAAGQVTAVSDMAVSPVSAAMQPQIIKSYSVGNHDRFMNLTFLNSKLAVFLSGIFILPLLFGADFILNLWLKNVPEFTGEIMILILIDEFIRQLTNGLSFSAIVKTEVKKIFLTTAVVQSIAFIISFLMLKIGFSFWVIFFVHIVVSLLVMVINILFVHFNLNIKSLLYSKKVILPSIGVALFLGGIYHLLFDIVKHIYPLYVMGVVFVITAVLLFIFLFDSVEKIKIKTVAFDTITKLRNKYYRY